MDKDEIGKFVMLSIQRPIEDIVEQAIKSVNSRGFSFTRVEDNPTLWRDVEKHLDLDVWPTIAVSCLQQREELTASDLDKKKIVDGFYSLAQKSKRSEAGILTSFEADIQNGGFEQLFENKGIDFINSAIQILRSIGSKGKLRISLEALQTIERYAKDIKAYRECRKTLAKCDSRYYKSSECIPVLYSKMSNQAL